MKVGLERLLEDEMFLLRKLNTIKNIKNAKEMIDVDQYEYDLSVIFKNDHVEILFEMFLNYEKRNKMNFEIQSHNHDKNLEEFTNNFIKKFEWKEGISLRDFFQK